jgi:subtilisin family serine protease
MDPALHELIRSGRPDDEVAVLLRLEGDAVPEGATIVSRFGRIATARVPRYAVEAVHDSGEVRSVKAPRLYEPDWVASPPAESIDVEVRPSDERRPPNLAHTGKGVVVAFVDWGFDFAHSDFCNPDGTTRLLGLWDQRARKNGVSNNRYGYGWVHDRNAVNLALKEPNPYAVLAYHPADAGPGPTHGTHTAGIAVGNGRSGGPKGMAPDAHIIFVHLATATGERGDSLGDSVALLEAVDFIARLAGTRPWVLNLSMGRQAGPHDGTLLTEQGIDAALAAGKGRACSQSTGNYFGRPIHTRGVLRPGEVRDIAFYPGKQGRAADEIEIWYPGRDRITVELIAPSGELAARAVTGQQSDIRIGGAPSGHLYNRWHDPNNHDNVAHFFLSGTVPEGAWTLRLRGVDVIDGRFHCWVERDAGCSSCQPAFHPSEVDHSSTTGTICNGYLSIAVGAYDPHRPGRPLSAFGSSGPTRDGRFKPDLLAPGVDILSARSTPRDTNIEYPPMTRMSGTSMAAPFVAGTIALMFEIAGTMLPVRRTRELLLKVAEPLTTGEPQRRWGSGYINVVEAVAAAGEAGSITPPARRKVHGATSEGAWRFPLKPAFAEAVPSCGGRDEQE